MKQKEIQQRIKKEGKYQYVFRSINILMMILLIGVEILKAINLIFEIF